MHLWNPRVHTRSYCQCAPSSHVSYLLFQCCERSLATVLQGDCFCCSGVELNQSIGVTHNWFGEDVEFCVAFDDD